MWRGEGRGGCQRQLLLFAERFFEAVCVLCVPVRSEEVRSGRGGRTVS
jgi:hypothetical protein